MLREERNLKNWKLIYDAPAEIWEEALPLGNGSLGAMTYGRIQEDRINLNLDTLWSGFGREKGNTKGIADWKLIRELLKEKQEKEIEDYLKENILGDWTESYLPTGDLILKLQIE